MGRIKLLALLIFIIVFFILGTILSGCGLLPEAAPKPENTGPTGEVSEPKPNLSFLEKIRAAPGGVYDLEEVAGKLFGLIISKNWAEAEQSFANLKSTWQKVKSTLNNNDKNQKNFEEGDIALELLANAITAKKILESGEALNKFMANVSKMSRAYQLSPAADIISIGNAVRDVGLYVEIEDWEKASSKFAALEDAWNQAKPVMEQAGILDELTKTHFIIGQMKGAVEAENKNSFVELSSDINGSLGKIRNFFYGK